MADYHVAGVQHVEHSHDDGGKDVGDYLSNRKTPRGLVTACMGICHVWGDFSERSEQEALLGVLEEMEVQHAWPGAKVGLELKKAWGW